MSASSWGEDVPAPRWNIATRLAFRFFFSFFLLYLPVPIFIGIYRPAALLRAFWGAIVPRVANIVFGVTVIVDQQNGSGDSTWDWMHLFTLVMLSLVITIVWSIVDRKRLAYPRLHVFFRVYLRFSLAFVMFSYGIAKVIPMQFQPPSLDRLTQRFGDASPMGLLWTFMGASVPYTIFSGLGEVIGGLLLTTRRTALLGALVSAAVLVNIVMLNFSYDVPVKIFSSVLLLAALTIAAPDARRLANVLVLNRPTEAPPLRPSFGPPWLSLSLRVARTVLIVWFVATSFQRTLVMRQRLFVNNERSPRHGIWRVDELAIDGVVHPPLLTDAMRWRRVIFNGTQTMAIEWMDDRRERFTVTHDLKGFMLRKRNDPMWYAYLGAEQPDPNTLRVEGEIDGRKLAATLHKVPLPPFLLTTRGFHWINDVPFNR